MNTLVVNNIADELCEVDLKNAWWVYILQCSDASLYTGVARDMGRRFGEHNNSPKAAKYTRVRRPVQLVYLEAVIDRSAAQKRECAIKNLTRNQKKQLISLSALGSSHYADKLELPLLADII